MRWNGGRDIIISLMKSLFVGALLGGSMIFWATGWDVQGQTELHPPMLLPDQGSRPPVAGPPPAMASPAQPAPLGPPAANTLPAPPLTAARVQFATPSYDFGRTQAGQLVRYDYVFTNIGTETLEITDVRTSCGCTTAGTYQRKVEPGQTGSIPIQFNGANFNGPVHKEITVSCNASNQPQVRLELKGTVWRAIEISPTYVYFNVMPDSPTNETKVVRILNNLDTPLTLSEPEINNPGFKAELKTVRPNKEFELQVSALQLTNAGTTQASITVKTSSTNMPVVSVSAVAVVQQVITVIPSQLMLPSGALPSSTRMGVTIRNNGQAPITVSEPTFPVQGVDVQVQEVQTGRVFNVLISFPQGFELPAGRRSELVLKTSHPLFPALRVPAMQAPRPVTAPAGARSPLEMVPSSVYLNVSPEAQTNASREVRITNTRETPVTLSEPESSNPAFGAELQTIQAGKEFKLVVKTLRSLGVGTTQGRITLKTSLPSMPVLNLPVVAMVQQLIAAIPSQLMLPPVPPASGSQVGFTIRNNAQAPISLSDAAIDLEGPQLKIQEVQAGHIFRVMLSMPPGFELPAGRKTEISVKTSHPQYPIIKVPLLQMPKPARNPPIPPRAAGPSSDQSATPANALAQPSVVAPQPPAPANATQK